MRGSEIKSMRDDALYNTYRECLETCDFESLDDIAEHVATCPAPRFYIDGKALSNIIWMIENNMSLINFHELSRRRAWYLYNEYKRWIEANPNCGMGRVGICELLVNMPAPEYYIKGGTARKIIQRKCAERRKKLMSL